MHKSLFKYIIPMILLVIISSCTREDGSSIFKPKRVSPPSLENKILLANVENLGRSSWQKPAFIVSKLGDIEGKTVADIGCGAGYFTFHLAHLNASVIAIDIDQDMLAYIESSKKNLGPDISPNVTSRLAGLTTPNLEPQEVDKALIVNTIGYINNLSAYFATLRAGIKKGGTLVISDFIAPDSHVPSPKADKIVNVRKVESDLIKAGYVDVEVDDTTLPYQYVVTAKVP